VKQLLNALLAASLFGAACGSSSSPTAASTPAPPTVQTVVFSFSDGALISFTQPGATAQVTALGIFTNGTTRDVTSTCTNWQSDNTSILSVNSSGLMTAQASSGSATISMTCQGVSAHGLVTLNPPPSPNLVGNGPATTSCPNPPYEITRDSNGRQHCREIKTGEFALDACCGLP
jgi:hypothetical protein